MLKKLTLAGLIAVSAGAFAVVPASAKIRCKDGFQIIRGAGPHATPYCEIKNLATVARRSYGLSTSFAKLRNSDIEREHVCQAIGHDHRVYSTCLDYRNDSDRIRIK